MVRIRKLGISINVTRVVLGFTLAIIMVTAPDLPPGVNEVVLTLLMCFTLLIIALSIEKDNGSTN